MNEQTNPNFAAILSKPMTEIKQAPPVPVGSYHCLVDGAPTFGQSTQKKTDYVEFAYKILQAGTEVDQGAIAAYAEFGGVIGKVIKGPSTRFYLTEPAAPMLKEFLVNSLGIDESKSIGEGLAEAPGKQLTIQIGHGMSQDGKRMFHEVRSTSKV